MHRRRAVVLVGIVLLAGCVGTLGGNTPAGQKSPETDSATKERPAASLNATRSITLDSLSARNATIVEGESLSITATVDTGDAAGSATATLFLGDRVADRKRLSLGDGATRRVALEANRTQALASGTYEYTVAIDRSSGNEPKRSGTVTVEKAIPIDGIDRDTYDGYRTYIESVRSRTTAIESARIETPQVVVFTLEPDASRFEAYTRPNATVEPVPQAAALELAADDDGPDAVGFVLPNATGAPLWYSGTNQTEAARLASGAMTPAEFRQSLKAQASGRLADDLRESRRTSARRLPSALTWATGDRARRAYADALVDRIEHSPQADRITVSGSGLFDDPLAYPDIPVSIDANSSIVVEFTVDRASRQVSFRTESLSSHALPQIVAMNHWANLTVDRSNGATPQNLRIRLVDRNGTRFRTIDMAAGWVRAVADPKRDISFADAFYTARNTVTDYNGGPETRESTGDDS